MYSGVSVSCDVSAISNSSYFSLLNYFPVHTVGVVRGKESSGSHLLFDRMLYICSLSFFHSKLFGVDTVRWGDKVLFANYMHSLCCALFSHVLFKLMFAHMIVCVCLEMNTLKRCVLVTSGIHIGICTDGEYTRI